MYQLQFGCKCIRNCWTSERERESEWKKSNTHADESAKSTMRLKWREQREKITGRWWWQSQMLGARRFCWINLHFGAMVWVIHIFNVLSSLNITLYFSYESRNRPAPSNASDIIEFEVFSTYTDLLLHTVQSYFVLYLWKSDYHQCILLYATNSNENFTESMLL